MIGRCMGFDYLFVIGWICYSNKLVNVFIILFIQSSALIQKTHNANLLYHLFFPLSFSCQTYYLVYYLSHTLIYKLYGLLSSFWTKNSNLSQPIREHNKRFSYHFVQKINNFDIEIYFFLTNNQTINFNIFYFLIFLKITNQLTILFLSKN